MVLAKSMSNTRLGDFIGSGDILGLGWTEVRNGLNNLEVTAVGKTPHLLGPFWPDFKSLMFRL